jgi:hypothetical protein
MPTNAKSASSREGATSIGLEPDHRPDVVISGTGYDAVLAIETREMFLQAGEIWKTAAGHNVVDVAVGAPRAAEPMTSNGRPARLTTAWI